MGKLYLNTRAMPFLAKQGRLTFGPPNELLCLQSHDRPKQLQQQRNVSSSSPAYLFAGVASFKLCFAYILNRCKPFKIAASYGNKQQP